jgi:hypothetical protein
MVTRLLRRKHYWFRIFAAVDIPYLSKRYIRITQKKGEQNIFPWQHKNDDLWVT